MGAALLCSLVFFLAAHVRSRLFFRHCDRATEERLHTALECTPQGMLPRAHGKSPDRGARVLRPLPVRQPRRRTAAALPPLRTNSRTTAAAHGGSRARWQLPALRADRAATLRVRRTAEGRRQRVVHRGACRAARTRGQLLLLQRFVRAPGCPPAPCRARLLHICARTGLVQRHVCPGTGRCTCVLRSETRVP